MNCWPSSSWCVCLRWIRCALAIETVMKNVRKSSFSSLFNKRLIEWRFRKESKEHLILLCVVLCRLAPDNAWPLFQTWYLQLFFGHLLLDVSNFFSFFLCVLMACSAFVTLANTWSVQIPLYLLSPDPWICEPNPKIRFRSIVYSGILVSSFFWYHPVYLAYTPTICLCPSTIDNEKWKQIQSLYKLLFIHLHKDLNSIPLPSGLLSCFIVIK